MPPKHHNPGLPVTLKFAQDTVVAFSISALSTYALVPELNCAFDMGDCLLDAVPLQHVFVTHAHGDHTRCLFRHDSLRRLLGMEPATYYVPQATLAGFQALSEAWSRLEYPRLQPAAPPPLRGLGPGDVVWLHRQLAAKAFNVRHTVPSLGYTLFDVRKKLKAEYQSLAGPELANLRREGVAFEEELWLPRITFIGDSTIDTLYDAPEVGRSRILFLEVTFLMDGEQELARKRGHTHVDDLLRFLNECPDVLQNEHIVLKHFSMRYDRPTIQHILRSRLPADFMERVRVLI